MEAQVGKGTASGEGGVSIVSILGQARLSAGWSLWVPGATSGWCSTEQLEPLPEQSRKCLMQLQAAGCVMPGAAQAEVNPVTMSGGGPIDAGGGPITLHSLYNPTPGRQERSVNGMGSPKRNELNSCFSSAVHLL